jgi:hypothetical protein
LPAEGWHHVVLNRSHVSPFPPDSTLSNPKSDDSEELFETNYTIDSLSEEWCRKGPPSEHRLPDMGSAFSRPLSVFQRFSTNGPTVVSIRYVTRFSPSEYGKKTVFRICGQVTFQISKISSVSASTGIPINLRSSSHKPLDSESRQ